MNGFVAFLKAIPIIAKAIIAINDAYKNAKHTWREKKDDKAVEKAKDGDTDDLRDQLGKMVLVFFCCSFLIGCASSQKAEVKSVCKLDLEAQMCWLNKEKNEGFPFSEMAKQQSECKSSGEPCWLAIDTKDMQHILKRLNRCENPTK